MRWDRFFEDIEDQLESEWEAERAALDTEAERLRMSSMTLHERLSALCVDATERRVTPVVEVVDGTRISAPVTAVGVDWLLAAPWSTRTGAALVPVAAIASVTLPEAELLGSARGRTAPSGAVSRRATFGFAVRDLVRRRCGVRVHLRSGGVLSGTADRAGADHLDMALHDEGAVRRSRDVRGYRLVPFAAIAWIAVDSVPGA